VKIIFLGRGPIAEACFEKLQKQNNNYSFSVEVVVSDNSFWRRFRETLKHSGILFLNNDKRREDEILREITERQIDCLISVQHVWILSERILTAVRGFAFNLHNAKLPEYGGFNTITHAILNGDKNYTTTIHWMMPQVDTGDIAYEETIPIEDSDTAYSLYQKTIGCAVCNFQKLLSDLSGNIPPPKIPIQGQVKFYRRCDIEQLRKIRNISDEEEVFRKVRAFYFPPYLPAVCDLGGVLYGLIPLQQMEKRV
jgi:methionyl-tRNA formyltransferase